MAILVNRTGLPGEMQPSQDAQGRFVLTVIVKGSYVIGDAAVLTPDDVQQPLNLADEYRGEPGASSLLEASDLSIYKPQTDIAVIGHAHAPAGRRLKSALVEVAVGSLRKRLLVHGDRVWRNRLGVLLPSEPQYFERMPLVYERAFGGVDQGQREERNPVGVGFGRRHAGAPLPNLEDERYHFADAAGPPVPQGLGFIPGDWRPRKDFIGTYDAHWQAHQFPLPPADFDARYFQAAHPEMRFSPHLAGHEDVELIGLSPQGAMRFALPGLCIGLAVQFRTGKPHRRLALLDTLTIRPDTRRTHIVWRHAIACRQKILDVEQVTAFPIRLSTVRRLSRAPAP